MTWRIVAAILLLQLAWPRLAAAQFFDPNTSLILSTLREISLKHNLGLQQQRLQTAKMVQQLKQFYDTYSLLRNDIEFTQSLYRDLDAVKRLNLSNAYAVSDFVINADRLNYWLPGATSDLTRSAMDAQSLLSNADALQRTYESFAVSVQKEEIPQDLEARRRNALVGQEVFSRALLEYAIKSQVLAKTYDSLAVELQKQVTAPNNKFTEAERTQLLLKAVDLRELSNEYYEKYLKLSQEAHTNELSLFDRKLDFLSKRFNWQALKSQVNKTSKIRYGFFDISRAPMK